MIFIKKEDPLKSPPYMPHIHHSHQTYMSQTMLLLYMLLRHPHGMPQIHHSENPAKVSSVTSCLIPPTM